MPAHNAAPAVGPAAGFALCLPPDALRPLVAAVVAEVLVQLESVRATLPDKLAFTEAEAARLLSLNTHQLRDERLRGRIAASRIVGNRIAYQREDLVEYLTARRVAANEAQATGGAMHDSAAAATPGAAAALNRLDAILAALAADDDDVGRWAAGLLERGESASGTTAAPVRNARAAPPARGTVGKADVGNELRGRRAQRVGGG